MSHRDNRFDGIIRAYGDQPDTAIKAQMAQFREGTPERAALEHILNERAKGNEERRHREALDVGRSANRLAKWAIAIAVAALILSVIQTFQ